MLCLSGFELYSRWVPLIYLSLPRKCLKPIGIIHKSRLFSLSTHSLRTIYNSMILPYIHYCNLAWECTYKSNLN